MSRVPESLRVKVPFKCRVCKSLSARVSSCPSSARVAQVLKCLECPSVQVPFECPSVLSTLRVPFKCLRTLWVTIKCPLSVQVSFEGSSAKKMCKITGNGHFNNFIEFIKDFSEYMFYITGIVFCLLGSKMCKF